MLIARAPVRISFAGGGTDLPSYYLEHGGLVVSTSIDKYFYVIATLNGADTAQITSADYRTFFRQRRGQPVRYEGDLTLPRAFLHEFGIDSSVSLFLASEIPPGTGLGSSSTVSVALAKALSTLCDLYLTHDQLARLASHVEIVKLGMPIGLQDQYAAAFGGLNALWFGRNSVSVEPLDLAADVQATLERRMLLFFTGVSRSAAAILRDQQTATEQRQTEVVASLHAIKEMAQQAIAILRAGDLAAFGALLDESWQAKKRLAHGISNPRIDEWYDLARAHGARGGKITGAGGGGFLLLYCEEPYQEAVTAALEAKGLVRMDYHFEQGGAVVLMDTIPRVRRIGAPERLTPSLAAAFGFGAAGPADTAAAVVAAAAAQPAGRASTLVPVST
jgi:D-glycero-alpha-D-manno-heptose-7-phosphate kinase